MLDKNNLNRIRGILSARQGAEIPKFQEGAKFAMYNGSQVIYSSDQLSWFTDEALSLKYPGSLGGFKSIQYTPTTKKQPLKPADHLPLAIPGDPSITPTSAVETAAANVASAQQKEGQLSEAAYLNGERYQPVKIDGDPLAGLNSPPVLNTGLASSELAAYSEKSARMKLDQIVQDQAKKDARYAAVGQAAGAALQGIGAAVGANQKATDSNTTKTIDTAYGAAAEGIKQTGPVGQVIGTAMQMGQVAGDIIQSLGGGTDQQTTTDKWMDSALFSWNIGMLNGFAGKNTQDFGVDHSIMSQVGSSYGDSVNSISEAADKAGKKYGLFSAKARKKADAAINLARSQQNAMGNIADTAASQRLAVQSMGEQAGLAYSMMTSGGYDQKYTYAAKQGGSLECNQVIELDWEPQVELNWDLAEFKKGGTIDINEELEWIPELQSGGKPEEQYPEEYLQFKASLPDNQKNTPESEYDTYLGWKLYGKPTDFESAKELGMYAWDNSDNSWHGNTIAWDKTTGIGHFLKPKHHSTLGYELDWFNKGIVTEEGGKQREMTSKERKEWEDFKSRYTLVDDGNFYKYVPKNKEGGSLGDSDIPEIEETNQKNVIPEGALHKNKHHMEHAEGLTKKGIPVIDDDGEQQAEIEHSEIIFTLEVTKKLEEYYKIFYSDDATNKEKEQAALDAGKLLVYQILENTEDRTGLIDSCKKGGTLTFKKSTEDLIEEALEWIPTIVVIEEESTKTSKKKEEKSDKELMKEAIKEVLVELLIK